ncbi:protein fosB [Latimeria chalumnae]|uniref:FosB proto-onco, AP-1 transcription factor subunit n=1 Tax=Latimeria chalumnae TaxID=7897 RepID=H3AYX6_LATCH|nr:PREDICTED: protein fosB [Latimeria chalumnae]|eukprot:XP_005991652.1 PREDICTED: protein fosB [Latimeria chalumnae]
MPREMYQGFPSDYDSTSRCSSSPSAESQYLSSVDSFGSPATSIAPPECTGVGEMPGSFVPTVTAITTSQDLQWMVQPTLISSVAQGQPQGQPMSHPPNIDLYDLPGTSYSTPGMSSYSGGAEVASTSSTRPTRARTRRTREEALTPEEEEKRRVRRERNKLAAAKCRNRRRELTDRLQTETDQLEEEKAELESEIAELQKEKERLEFVLVAHKPGCKIPYEDMPDLTAQPSTSAEVSSLGMAVKEDPFGPPSYPSAPHQFQQNLGVQVPGAALAEVAFCSSFYAHSEPLSDTYPANPSYTSSFVFTYPEGSTCGATHQRNSSSDQSSDSLSSPSLLAL